MNHLTYITLMFIVGSTLTYSHAGSSLHSNRANIVEFPEIQMDPLNRLFYSKEDRALMDDTRRNSAKGESEIIDIKTPVTVIPPDLYIKGVVIKKDGKHTVWSSSDNTLFKPSTVDAASLNPKAIRKNGSVRLNYDETKFRLRPGQVWSVREDQIKERHLYNPIEEAEEIPIEIGEDISFEDEEINTSSQSTDNRPEVVKERSKLMEQASQIRARTESATQSVNNSN